MPDYTLRKATSEDRETLLGIMIEAAEWMQYSGIRQWVPEQFSMEMVNTYLNTRDVYILQSQHEPAGMFTLQDDDPDYWGTLNIPGYSYLHRLVVRVPYRGQGLGERMIREAARITHSYGRLGLRLDTRSTNFKLNRFYQSLGFVAKGMGHLDGKDYVLYEMDMNIFNRL